MKTAHCDYCGEKIESGALEHTIDVTRFLDGNSVASLSSEGGEYDVHEACADKAMAKLQAVFSRIVETV